MVFYCSFAFVSEIYSHPYTHNPTYTHIPPINRENKSRDSASVVPEFFPACFEFCWAQWLFLSLLSEIHYYLKLSWTETIVPNYCNMWATKKLFYKQVFHKMISWKKKKRGAWYWYENTVVLLENSYFFFFLENFSFVIHRHFSKILIIEGREWMNNGV